MDMSTTESVMVLRSDDSLLSDRLVQSICLVRPNDFIILVTQIHGI